MKDNHNIICIAIPTCEPYVFKKYWMSSLENIIQLKDICTIAINFQYPWSIEESDEVIRLIKNMGFRVRESYSEYEVTQEGCIPFCKIRQDTADLCEDAMFYVLTDDDFKYLGPSTAAPKHAGEQYIDIVHYMMTHEKCGFTLIGGSMIRKIPKNTIGPISLSSHITNLKGIVIRRMKEFSFLPQDSLDLLGAGEERIMAASRFALGYYPAKMGFGRTHHYEVQNKPDVISGIEMYKYDSLDIIDNNVNKYLRDKYGATTGKSLHDGDIIDYNLYYDNNGIAESEFEKYQSINYTNINSCDLIEEIIDMYQDQK